MVHNFFHFFNTMIINFVHWFKTDQTKQELKKVKRKTVKKGNIWLRKKIIENSAKRKIATKNIIPYYIQFIFFSFHIHNSFAFYIFLSFLFLLSSSVLCPAFQIIKSWFICLFHFFFVILLISRIYFIFTIFHGKQQNFVCN